MCSVYPGQPWCGAASGSRNRQSPDSAPSTLLPPRPAQRPPASSQSPDTLRAEGDPFPSGISGSLHLRLGDGSLAGLCDVTKDSELGSTNTGPGRGGLLQAPSTRVPHQERPSDHRSHALQAPGSQHHVFLHRKASSARTCASRALKGP